MSPTSSSLLNPGNGRWYRFPRVSAVLSGAVLLLAAYGTAAAQNAVKAETFVDAVGIDIHLHYTDTMYYTNFPAVRAALEQLHLRHVRDGLLMHPIPEYAARHKLLAAEGIHADFIASPDEDAGAISDFAAHFSSSLEFLEAPNEWDIQKDAAWASTLRRYLPMLYASAQRLHIPVIGPSLVKIPSYTSLGDVSAWETFGNMHNYPGGRNPGTAGWGDNGYGSLTACLRNVELTSDHLPVITTETGYNNDPAGESYVPEDVSAVYLPRLLLTQFMGGVRRTYLYELLSSGHEDFGLLSAQANPKPAFFAVASLLTLLDDHDGRTHADALPLTVDSQDTRVRHLLLQKHDGRYLLALWIEAPIWDVPHRAPLQVNDEVVRLHLPVIPGHAVAHRWQRDGHVRDESVSLNRDTDLNIGSLLTVFEFRTPHSLSQIHSGQPKGKM